MYTIVTFNILFSEEKNVNQTRSSYNATFSYWAGRGMKREMKKKMYQDF